MRGDERLALVAICRRLHLVPGDVFGRPGDCQYQVVRTALQIGEDIAMMRLRVRCWLEQNMPPEEFAPSDEGGAQTYRQYLDNVMNDEYGDQMSLRAMCDIYGFNYTVLSADGNVSQSHFPNSTRRVYLGYMAGLQHYVSIVGAVSFLRLQGIGAIRFPMPLFF